MSQTQPIPDTKSSTSNVLRRRGRPSKTETTLQTTSEAIEVAETVAQQVIETKATTPHETVIDLELLYTGGTKSPEQEKKEVEMFNKMKKLDYAIDYANKNKVEWLEVDQDVMEHLYKGPVPEVGYYILKGIKLCLQGKAESLAARDNLTCHEILFPKEDYMKLGVRSGRK